MNPTTSQPAFCPSCERYIGPADSCPYCDTDSARPPILQHLRILSLLLALAGTAILLILSRATEPVHVPIGSIEPAMNFARVRLSGTVTRKPFIDDDDDDARYLSFIIDDGTGRARVVASGRVAADMAGSDSIPDAGSSVRVEGVLNIEKDGLPRLRLNSGNDISCNEEAPASGGIE